MDQTKDRHKVRVANVLDLEDITDFIVENGVDTENNLDSIAPADSEAIRSSFFSLLGPEQKGIVLLSTFTTKEGLETITGILALGETDLWWSKQKIITNVLFYVDPFYRSFGIADALLNRGKEIIRTIEDRPAVFNTFLFTDKVGSMERYLKIKGFEPMGSTLLYTGN